VLHVGANQLAVTGHEVLCATDRTTMKPKPLPEDLRSLLAPFVFSEDEARTQLL
jgi:acyl-CoA thioesterase FadM